MFRDRTRPLSPLLPRLDPDVALVRQYRATASPAVFEILFRKYQTQVFSLVYRMVNGEEAYDLTQEVFLRAMRSLGGFQGDAKFRTWLLTIARNVCLNHLREQRLRQGLTEGSFDAEPEMPGHVPEAPDPGADVARIAETHELQRVVDKVLAEMTPEQRLLLTLRDLQGLSYEEVAEITELSLANVKSKLHRARLAFRTKFQPYLDMVDPDALREPTGGTRS